MIDNGLVLSTQKEMARVKVVPVETCHQCPARLLCAGQKSPDGTLSVLNPVNAQPGDEVSIEVPEARYYLDIALLFGGLLLASLVGLGAGYFAAPAFGIPVEKAGFVGLLVGLVAGGLGLSRYFRTKKKRFLYPVIIAIIEKGDSHGQA